MIQKIRNIGFISALSLTAILSGCQYVGGGLEGMNNAFSGSGNNHIHNQWNVSDDDAMAWLSHNHIIWSDHGKLSHVNWYKFWAQQIHYRTNLAGRAYVYCNKKSWQTSTPGANCQTYFQASAMTSSEESQSMGDNIINHE